MVTSLMSGFRSSYLKNTPISKPEADKLYEKGRIETCGVKRKKALVGRLEDNISGEPEWLRKFIILRAESENISWEKTALAEDEKNL